MSKKTLEALCEEMMSNFMQFARGPKLVIKRLPGGFLLCNQRADQKTIRGRLKFIEGLETISLIMPRPNGDHVLVEYREVRGGKSEWVPLKFNDYKSELKESLEPSDR